MKDIYNEKYTPPYTWLAWWELQGMRMLSALAGVSNQRGEPGVENYNYNDVRMIIIIVILLKMTMEIIRMI